jgi:hypothetical protein
MLTSENAVAADGRGFDATAEAGDERPSLRDGRSHGWKLQ